MFKFSELFTKFEKFIKFPNEFFLNYFQILKYSDNSKRQKICGFQIIAAIVTGLNYQNVLGVKNICAVPAILKVILLLDYSDNCNEFE